MKRTNSVKLWFDRLLSKSIWQQILILGAALVVALGLSYILLSLSCEEWKRVSDDTGLSRWLLPVYLLIDSNVFSNLYMADDPAKSISGWMLFASSITFLLGAFVFNGIIIGIITNSIEQRVADHKAGMIHYLEAGHYIIMGYDDMVPSIISHIFEKDKDSFVLLLSAAESEYIREKLKKIFDEEQLKHIIVNYGHRTSTNYYKDIHIETAEQVFIVGQRTIQSHDAINVECVDSICTYLEQPTITCRPKRITCVFEDLDTYAAFKTSEIFDRVKNLDIEFVPYNFYAGWAKQVFVKQYYTDKDHPGEKLDYPAVYGKGYSAEDVTTLRQDDKRYVHLVFVGTTNFAVAFAMEAAQVLHFPNNKNGVKTRITFIDKNADTEKDEFIVRNRHFFEVQQYYYRDVTKNPKDEVSRAMHDSLYFTPENGYKTEDANFLDIEFEFIKGDVFSQPVQDILDGWAREHGQQQYLSVFLTIPKQRQNFVMAMNMPDAIYHKQVPIFIRQDRSDNFVSNLRNADLKIKSDEKKNRYYSLEDGQLQASEPQGGRYANIYPFGMNETAFCADDKSLQSAKLINYLYSNMTPDYHFQSETVLNAMTGEQLRNEADKYWRGLTVALKWSNLYNAYNISVKLDILRAMRGLDHKDLSQDFQPLSDEESKVLARVEHNRWNVEKLLMGYRKPHTNEDKYAKDSEIKGKLKLNKNRFIHHDIRAFEDLEGGIGELDIEFSRYIPWILKMTEK